MKNIHFDYLNPSQRQAVNNIHGSYMILAGAGTGKTRVITYRIANMVQKGIDPKSIVAVTFTNKAAREMRERVAELMGKELAKETFIGTFHSFCLQLLRRNTGAAKLHGGFSLAGTSEQIDLVRKSLEEKHWEGHYRPEELLARISQAKNNLLSPQQVTNSAAFVNNGTFHDGDLNLLREVYDLYERQLSLNRVIDFDDCIFKVVKLLEANADTYQKIQNQYQYFLVDEYQDTNLAQLRLLELLACGSKNICVVGDDDQSIYGWRGAMSSVIERFEEMFPKTTLIKLEQNYRCSNIILNAANTVIKNNPKRKDKTLWSDNQIDHKICLSAHKSDEDEASWIANKCLGLLGQGLQPRDIGVLYRANTQAKALEFSLREANINYKVFGGSSFFEKKEVKDFLAYLRLCFNHDDRMAFYRIINTPARGFGLKTLEKIEKKSLELNISPFKVIEGDHVQTELTAPMRTACKVFVATITDLSHLPLSSAEDLEILGKQIIGKLRLEDDIRQKNPDQAAQRKKIESLRRIPAWLRQVVTGAAEDVFLTEGCLDKQALLDRFLLQEEPDNSKSIDKDANYVSLMTIHSAKGLEFSNVFLCGVEDDMLPHKNSLESAGGIEEERRLFYVAITRAKQRLFLSYALERFSGYQSTEKKPSRFLKELPVDGSIMQPTKSSELTGDEKKQKNIERLNQLKERLKTNFLAP